MSSFLRLESAAPSPSRRANRTGIHVGCTYGYGMIDLCDDRTLGIRYVTLGRKTIK